MPSLSSTMLQEELPEELNSQEVVAPVFGFSKNKTLIEQELLSIMTSGFEQDYAEKRQEWKSTRQIHCPSIILSRGDKRDSSDNFEKSMLDVSVTQTSNDRFERGTILVPAVNMSNVLDEIVRRDIRALSAVIENDTYNTAQLHDIELSLAKSKGHVFLTALFYKTVFRAGLYDNTSGRDIMTLKAELDERAIFEGLELPSDEILFNELAIEQFKGFRPIGGKTLKWFILLREIVKNWASLFNKLGFRMILPFEIRKSRKIGNNRITLVEGERVKMTASQDILGYNSELMSELMP